MNVIIYEDQANQIGLMIKGLNAMEDTVRQLNPGTGLNAQLTDQLPVTSDMDELLGFMEDQIGGVWGFRTATVDECKTYREGKTKNALS